MGSSSGAPLLVAHPSRGKEDLGDQRRLRWCCGVSSEGRWAEATAEAGRLAALAAPMIAVALLQLMMQVISTIMVGHLGEVPLAGAAIAGSLTNVSGFSVLVSVDSFIYIYLNFKSSFTVKARSGRGENKAGLIGAWFALELSSASRVRSSWIGFRVPSDWNVWLTNAPPPGTVLVGMRVLHILRMTMPTDRAGSDSYPVTSDHICSSIRGTRTWGQKARGA